VYYVGIKQLLTGERFIFLAQSKMGNSCDKSEEEQKLLELDEQLSLGSECEPDLIFQLKAAEQRVQQLEEEKKALERKLDASIELSDETIHAIVKKWLDNESVNIKGLPDVIEEKIYEHLICILIHIVKKAIANIQQ